MKYVIEVEVQDDNVKHLDVESLLERSVKGCFRPGILGEVKVKATERVAKKKAKGK